MRSPVCVDANIIVAMLTSEKFSLPALALWENWAKEDLRVTAPMLLRYEVISAIYRKELRELILPEDAHKALQAFRNQEIEFLDSQQYAERAYELAKEFGRPNTYDAHYLALAESLECPFWTADERIFNAANRGFKHIHWLGNYPSQ